MRRGVRRVAGLLPATLLLLVVLPASGFAVHAWLSGWRLQPVLSASMEPAYPRGSLLVVEPTEPDDVRPGSVLVFEDPLQAGRLVAHRVVSRTGSSGTAPTFRTQGDANRTADPRPVEADAVRGRVTHHVAGLGTVVHALRWPRNLLLLVALPTLLLVASELLVRRRRVRRARLMSPLRKPRTPVPAGAGGYGGGMGYKVEKSDAEWKAELSPEEYAVLRKAGTERAFTGEYTDTETTGVYKCKACQAELFRSDTKFHSGCGWPSFYQPITDTVEYIEDTSHGMKRVEVRCANCGSHLGHVFPDGYGTPTGDRYCINSVSLTLEPANPDA